MPRWDLELYDINSAAYMYNARYYVLKKTQKKLVHFMVVKIKGKPAKKSTFLAPGGGGFGFGVGGSGAGAAHGKIFFSKRLNTFDRLYFSQTWCPRGANRLRRGLAHDSVVIQETCSSFEVVERSAYRHPLNALILRSADGATSSTQILGPGHVHCLVQLLLGPNRQKANTSEITFISIICTANCARACIRLYEKYKNITHQMQTPRLMIHDAGQVSLKDDDAETTTRTAKSVGIFVVILRRGVVQNNGDSRGHLVRS